MLKKIIFFFLFFLLVVSSFYVLVIAEENPSLKNQEIKIEAKKIDYQLPYPGILPDHPLYFLKATRDRILDFFTRDYLKKAQLYLLFSDKRIVMGISLNQKGKWRLMTTTVSKAEKYAIKMVLALKKAKEQGTSPEGDFILTAKLSNEKHREILENLLKETPQGEQQRLKEVLELNRNIKKMLEQL